MATEDVVTMDRDAHVDAGTRRFLEEVRRLGEGRADASGEVRVIIFKRRESPDGVLIPDIGLATLQAAVGAVVGRRERYFAALFALHARQGDRAMLSVPLEPSPDLDAVPDGARVTYFGTLAPGRAVAIAVADELYFPVGPAVRPSWRTPRCGWSEAPA